MSLFGSSLVRFALIWWLTIQTGSATTLATATIMTMIPLIVVSPFAGVLIDRWPRKAVLVVSDGLIALISALLALLFWLGVAEPWHVFVAMFLRAVGEAFHRPAMLATTPLMVRDSWLTRVAGMNRTLAGILQFVTPALGAILISLFNVAAVVAIDVVTATIAIVPLLLTAVPNPGEKTKPVDRGINRFFREFSEGFTYIWSNHGIRYMTLAAMIWGIAAAGAPTFLPLLVTDRFAKGVAEIGLMHSLLGAAMIAGGIVLAAWGGFTRRIYTSVSGTLGLAIGGALIGLAPVGSYWVALIGISVIGFSLPIHGGPIGAIWQTVIPNELQGRFFSLTGSLMSLLGPITLAIAGPIADLYGVRLFYIIHPIGALLVAAIRIGVPSVRNLELSGDKVDPTK